MTDNENAAAKKGLPTRLADAAKWLSAKLGPAARTAGRKTADGAKVVASKAEEATVGVKDKVSAMIENRRTPDAEATEDNLPADSET